MKDQIAKELNLVGLEEHIQIIRIQDGEVDFVVNGATHYYAKTNKAGTKILKNSIRRNFS